MDEKDLIKYWNQKRSQLINSQLGPTVLFSVVLWIASSRDLGTLDTKTKALIAIVTGVIGLVSIVGQAFILREAHATVVSLKKLDAKLSPLAKSIAESERLVAWSGVLLFLISGAAYWVLLSKLFQ